MSALKFLYKNLVIHRDLKPENIVLSDNKEVVKIIDLGLAMVYKNAQDLGREVIGDVGTFKYMSPE